MINTNVVLFGGAGVGRSSVINSISGKDVAKASPDRWGCTLDFKHYAFEVRSRTFNIWETIGLKGCSFSSAADCLGAIEKSRTLIQQIEDKGGLDLLLFCIPEQIPRTSSEVCNYRLFFNVLCKGEIPIALVITHLENETGVDGWWSQNKEWFCHRNVQFTKLACVTSLEHPHPATYGEPLVDMLLKFSQEGRHPMPPASTWFSGFLERLPIIPFPADVKNNPRGLEELLRDRCMVLDTNACKVAVERLCHTETELSLFPEGYRQVGEDASFNIVLFGEAGVGKSSIINLIAGRNVSPTSCDTWGCTSESKQHTFTVANRKFNIWDTIGLGEPSFSTTEVYFSAIEKTYELIRQIEAEGGLDLLLFCIPGSRVTNTMQSNYRLFFEVLCDKRIPISVVVTRLEYENLMEFWWLRNRQYISKADLKFSGHACVTGLGQNPRQAREGRSALEVLLLKFDGRGRYRMPPASEWFDGFLARLFITPFLKLLKFTQTRRELERLLRSRCNMDKEKAKQLAANLLRIRSET